MSKKPNFSVVFKILERHLRSCFWNKYQQHYSHFFYHKDNIKNLLLKLLIRKM